MKHYPPAAAGDVELLRVAEESEDWRRGYEAGRERAVTLAELERDQAIAGSAWIREEQQYLLEDARRERDRWKARAERRSIWPLNATGKEICESDKCDPRPLRGGWRCRTCDRTISLLRPQEDRGR